MQHNNERSVPRRPSVPPHIILVPYPYPLFISVRIGEAVPQSAFYLSSWRRDASHIRAAAARERLKALDLCVTPRPVSQERGNTNTNKTRQPYYELFTSVYAVSEASTARSWNAFSVDGTVLHEVLQDATWLLGSLESGVMNYFSFLSLFVLFLLLFVCLFYVAAGQCYAVSPADVKVLALIAPHACERIHIADVMKRILTLILNEDPKRFDPSFTASYTVM
eukprot:gene9673-6770_t